MKKIINTLAVVLLLLTSSCSEWLDVKPKSEIKSDIMFETEQGFKDALIGCYIMMSENALYGKELTMTFLDVLAQQYSFLSTATTGPYVLAAQYRYTEGSNVDRINTIWSNMYTIIANLNNIIENLEVKRSILSPSNYATIKGEVYGLRAFLYFDLLRMFSYGDLVSRPEKRKELAIPYAVTCDKRIVRQHTLEEVLEYIHADIDVSIGLFQSKEGSVTDKDVPNEDKFYDREYRMLRFNVRAALATRMRVNMWEGNYDAAYVDAKKLIDDRLTWIPLHAIENAEPKNKDLAFSTEGFFKLETYKRFDEARRYFSLTVGDTGSQNGDCLYLTKERVEEIFEVKSNVGNADYRYIHLFDKTATYMFIKFWEYEGALYKDRAPLLKTAEVYYSAVECLLKKGDDNNKNEGVKLLNIVRNQRGIPKILDIPVTVPLEEAEKELFKEWRKEFIGDGQLFYYFKRLGMTSIPNTGIPGSDAIYLFPLPEREVDLGGRVDPSRLLKN